MFVPDTVESYFSFQRREIIEGEWWRLLAANFFHLNAMHLFLNILGVVGVWFVFSNVVSPFWQIVFLLSGMLSNTLFVLLFQPSIQSFVGLSGALHGVFVAYCIVESTGNKWLSVVGLAGVTGKIMMEQLGLSGQYVEHLILGKVIVNAHLGGAIGGMVVGIFYQASVILAEGRN